MKIPLSRLRFREGCLNIDGSYGEGGGQIVRTACALSALTGIACKITRIRAGRANPGLRPQHCTAIRGLASMFDATTSPVRVGAQELSFTPGTLKQTSLNLQVGTAGSVSLVFQSLLLASLAAEEPVHLFLRGGTDVPAAPACDYVRQVKIEILKRMGISVEFKVLRRGYFPKGGGIVDVRIDPSGDDLLDPLVQEEEAGAAEGSWGISHADATLEPRGVAEKQGKAARRLLTECLHVPARLDSEYGRTSCPGSGVVLWARCGDSVIGASALGGSGKTSERVAEEAAENLVRTYHARASMDPWLGDQILPYLALARGPSQISVPRVTRHMNTNMWLIMQFLNVRFFCENRDQRTLVQCIPEGDRR